MLSQSPREANFVVGHKVGLEVRGNTCWYVGREVETVGPGAQAWVGGEGRVGGEGEREGEAVEVKVEFEVDNWRGRELLRSRNVKIEICRGRELSRSRIVEVEVEAEFEDGQGRGRKL